MKSLFIILILISNLFADYTISNIANSVNCDFLIITDKYFSKQAERYCLYRESNKDDFVNSPKIIYTSDIYSTFYTLSKKDAIKKAIRVIKDKSPNLKYIMLLGTGTLDGDTGRENFVPIYFKTIYSYYQNRLISDDFYIMDSNENYYNDSIALTIGRVEARDSSQANLYIEKVKKYESNQEVLWKNRLLVAIDDDSNGYMDYGPDVFFHEKSYANYLHNDIPSYVLNNVLYMRNYSVTPSIHKINEPDYPAHRFGARDEFINRVNSGNLLTIFIGHGYYTVNSEEGLFEIYYFNDEELKPKGDRYTIYMSLSCLTGAFETNVQPLVSQAILHDGFAVAGIGSTTELSEYQNLILGSSLVSQIYSGKSKLAIGEAIINAKKSLSSSNFEASLSYVLFGDPSLVVHVPQLDSVNHSIPDSVVLNGQNGVVNGIDEYMISKIDTTYFFKYFYNTIKDSVTIVTNGKEIAYSSDFNFYNDTINVDVANLFYGSNRDGNLFVSKYYNIPVNTKKISILDKHNISKVLFYPNPAKNILFVDKSLIGGMILDNNGKRVCYVKSSRVNIANLNKGVYFILDKDKKSYSKFYKIGK